MKVMNILVKIFVLLIFVPLIVTSVPIGPLHFKAVSGGSMEPTITANDIVVVMPVTTQPEVGDIITFRYPSESDQEVIFVHRVIEVVEGGYITKGDANIVADGIVAPEAVTGIMIFKIPLLGALVNFVHTPAGYLTAVLLPSIILIIKEIREITRFL